MATDTLVQTLITMGMDRMTGGKTAFINVNREVLLSNPFDILDPQSVVLELLESIRDGFIAVDREWKIVYVNRSAEVLVSLRRERAVGVEQHRQRQSELWRDAAANV